MEDLIFDRSQSDVDHVIDVTRRISKGTASDEETAEFLQGRMKGSWNYIDLNRIESWTAYLYDILLQNGYVAEITPRSEQPAKSFPQAIEYIESTGTQYIDTGFKPNQDTRLTMDVEVLSQNSYPKALFGGRNGDTSTIDSFVCWIFDASNIRADYGNTNHSFSVSTPGRFTIEINKNSASVDSSSFTFSSSTFQSLYNLALFSQNDVGGIDTRMASIRLYSCKIYDNGTLVRDYKPYYDSNGVACLYDAVSSSFYYNAGTGTFIASEEYTGRIPVHTDWREYDIPTRSDIDRIRRNVDALQTGFQQIGDWRDIIYNNTMDFNQANALEWDLQRLYDWLQAMVNGFMTKQANTLFMIAGGVFNN